MSNPFGGKSNPSRRDALRQMTGVTGLVTLAGCQSSSRVRDNAAHDALFSWGVASGDPTRSAIVIWTRALPVDPGVTTLSVVYQVSMTPEFDTLLLEGVSLTTSSRDFTVKHDVAGLQPGTVYYYRFLAGSVVSATGRMKTLPIDDSRPVSLALASCANYPSGYFNVYREISQIADLDAVIHVGDYIYEHAAGEYDGAVGKRLGRNHVPAHEIVTLADYRQRLAQYREDPDLQAAHAHATFITVWDDHETANNSWKDGSSGQDRAVGDAWHNRRNAALQAYFEWLPMRDPVTGAARERLNRVYDFGSIASLIVIETRLTGRDQQISYERDMPMRDGAPDLETFERDVLNKPERTMMGAAQEAWFAEVLHASRQRGVQWQVIGNQTVMARMRTPDFMSILQPEVVDAVLANGGYASKWLQRSSWGMPAGLDAWDGYAAARERLYNDAQAADANMIVLSGDSHMFWANELHHPKTDKLVGLELATGSVTSPGGYGYIGNTPDFFDMVERAIIAKNEDVCYANVRDHGFIHLTLSKDAMNGRYMRVSTIMQKAYHCDCFLQIEATPGSGWTQVPIASDETPGDPRETAAREA
ncbi:alkaline phosphatase D family protein [Hyphomonas sp.]|uniref:alkaline phosphatase D family protein n=1 Tax=Hyphomonas sp. TaxID=87 RepID=UPI0030F846DB